MNRKSPLLILAACLLICACGLDEDPLTPEDVHDMLGLPPLATDAPHDAGEPPVSASVAPAAQRPTRLTMLGGGGVVLQRGSAIRPEDLFKQGWQIDPAAGTARFISDYGTIEIDWSVPRRVWELTTDYSQLHLNYRQTIVGSNLAAGPTSIAGTGLLEVAGAPAPSLGGHSNNGERIYSEGQFQWRFRPEARIGDQAKFTVYIGWPADSVSVEYDYLYEDIFR